MSVNDEPERRRTNHDGFIRRKRLLLNGLLQEAEELLVHLEDGLNLREDGCDLLVRQDFLPSRCAQEDLTH